MRQKKTMKRLCLTILASLTALSLAACHSENAPQATTPTTPDPIVTTPATTLAPATTPAVTSDPIVTTPATTLAPATTPAVTSDPIVTTPATTPATTPDPGPIGFAVEGSAEAVAERFVTDIYRETLMRVPGGSTDSVLDYAAISWEVYEVSGDGKTVKGKFSYGVLPEDYDNSSFWTGNGAPGTGEYEGWIVSGRYFSLEQDADGMWYCREMATGKL